MAWINHKQQRPHDGQAVLIYYAEAIAAGYPRLQAATYFEAVDMFDVDADTDVRPNATVYLFWQPLPAGPTPEQIAEAA